MKQITISDIDGFAVGQAQDTVGGSGCTVILCEQGCSAGVDVRGGGPATRETDLLHPINMVQKIHAVCLSGGSAFGLAAAQGVVRYLEERNCGHDMGFVKVPIVCGASLFDLAVADAKCRPDEQMGYQACLNRSNTIKEGNFGAGTGASVGKLMGMAHAMKSGIGVYGVQVNDLQVAAIVAVNACGNVVDEANGEQLAGILMGREICSTEAMMMKHLEKQLPSGNTTIGCIVTNAKLDKAQCTKISGIAHNGYARAIRPVHTMSDGDTIFVMANGKIEVQPDIVGVLATDCMAKAINRAVKCASSAYGLKAWKDVVKE
ncbi:peptidase S58 family protein [bacterium c-19]|nr:peptidase S58 family protein [bacterium c-19]